MFDAWRQNGRPTFYESIHSAWQADVLTTGLISAFGILALSFYIIIPGAPGWERLYSCIRITISLCIGAVIVVSQYTMTWESAVTGVHTQFKAGTGQEVKVTIGAWIGFKGINITLKGAPGQIPGETIDYNEHFSWDSGQGRLGFGPYAGRFNREYRAAQSRGLPLPILWVAEYFTFDGEGIRWGRYYRQAGWYSHVMLWLAFPCWLLANVLFGVLLRYGAYFLVMTGMSMLTANIIWSTMRNFIELKIPFSDTSRLEFTFGISFWACLATGVLCVILGVVIFILDKVYPTIIASFFNVDVLQDSEKILEEPDSELGSSLKKESSKSGPGGLHGDPGASADIDQSYQDDDDDDELYLPPPDMAQMHRMGSNQLIPSPQPSEHSLSPQPCTPGGGNNRKFHKQRSRYRSGESRMTIKFQKPRRKPPLLPQSPVSIHSPSDGQDNSSDEDIYANAAVGGLNLHGTRQRFQVSRF